MKKIHIPKTKISMKTFTLAASTLAIALVAAFPEPAYAGCSRWNLACKAREALNKAKDAANRAAAAAKATADRAAQEAQAAADRAAREAQAAADRAAQESLAAAARAAQESQAAAESAAWLSQEAAWRAAQDSIGAAERAASEAREAEEIAREFAERALRASIQQALDATFALLHNAQLGELANVRKIGDAGFWQETVLKAVLSSLSGVNVTDEIAKAAELLVKGLGTPTAEHPFGDGPFAVMVQNQTTGVLKQTSHVAQRGLLSALNPLKNPLGKDDVQVNTLSDYFEIQLPHPAKFKYEVAAAVKGELGMTIPHKATDWLDLKGSAQLKVPFIYGDFSETNTAFQSIVQDKRFKFQVAAGLALATNKKVSEVVKSKVENQWAFDVACSTQNIGQCQLEKISIKFKLESKQTQASDNLPKIKIALDTMIDLISQPAVAAILFPSNGDKKREFTNTLAQIRSYVDFAFQVQSMTLPPTSNAVSNAMVMMNGMGVTDITRGFMAHSQVTDVLDMYYKFAGKEEFQTKANAAAVKAGQANKTKYVYDETGAHEASFSFQYINQDVLDKRFRSGWKPVGGQKMLDDTRDFALSINDSRKFVSNAPQYFLSVLNFRTPQFFGIEVAKVGAAEVKMEVEFANSVKGAIAASTDAKAAFGIEVPLSSAAASYARDKSAVTTDVTHAEFDDANRAAGDDPYNIGASKNWGTTHEPFVASYLGVREDALTLPAFMVIAGH